MSLSLYRVPNGQQKGQSPWPCPFVYSPASALGSLSSVPLSSAPAFATLTRRSSAARKLRAQFIKSSHSFHEPTIFILRTFLREAIGNFSPLDTENLTLASRTQALRNWASQGSATNKPKKEGDAKL